MRGYHLLALMAAMYLTASCAAAQERRLPSCTGLVPALMRDPSSARNDYKLEGVQYVVDDIGSGPDERVCTALGLYQEGDVPIAYTARWEDDTRTAYDVNAHGATPIDEISRAASLRVRNHPEGQDGTFSVRTYVPYCTEPEFLRLARQELRFGISTRNAFYKEPDYDIFKIIPNGYGSGILSNCIATVGNDTVRGDIFIGTDWVPGQTQRRYQFYILPTGPEGWKLQNRLWTSSAE